MIEARSSSDKFRKGPYHICGCSTRPSWPMPSRMARANMSSVHVPAPVFSSGVMFGATNQGRSSQTWPAPFLFRSGGPPGAFQSRSEWQTKHCSKPSVRYLPRSRRAGVRSNFTSRNSRGREALLVDGEGFLELSARVFPLTTRNRHDQEAQKDAAAALKITSFAVCLHLILVFFR